MSPKTLKTETTASMSTTETTTVSTTKSTTTTLLTTKTITTTMVATESTTTSTLTKTTTKYHNWSILMLYDSGNLQNQFLLNKNGSKYSILNFFFIFLNYYYSHVFFASKIIPVYYSYVFHVWLNFQIGESWRNLFTDATLNFSIHAQRF